jgi:two-component system cell cycle response regulator DivK
VADALILIVEDNPRNLKLARDVLEFAGYRTVEAQDAEEGIRLAHLHGPDLILMDVQLPGMDGDEALRRLRESAATREIPVIAVTAFAMTTDRDRLLGEGFQGYLVKPISVPDFAEQVGRFIPAGAGEPER